MKLRVFHRSGETSDQIGDWLPRRQLSCYIHSRYLVEKQTAPPVALTDSAALETFSDGKSHFKGKYGVSSIRTVRIQYCPPVPKPTPRSSLFSFANPMNAEMHGSTNGHSQSLERDSDNFLRRSVKDLFSLEGRTIVITGGARGIGLTFAFAVAEAGGNVAILDVAEDPHSHFYELAKRHPKQRFSVFKYGDPSSGIRPIVLTLIPRTDVTNYEVLQRTIVQVVDEFGRIDGL